MKYIYCLIYNDNKQMIKYRFIVLVLYILQLCVYYVKKVEFDMICFDIGGIFLIGF